MKVLAVLFLAAAAVQGMNHRQPKAFGSVSLFNVVTFKNDPCDSTENIGSTTSESSQRQGNCVASSECTEANGKAAGTCAAGFGVCCVFTMNDDDETSVTVTRNNTYLQNPSFPTAYAKAETFTYEFKKQNKDICAIRLDFESFTLAQPATEAAPAANAGCTDKFEITAISSGLTIPEVCGSLTGQHMYLYLGNDKEDDSATAKLTTVGTATMRTWDIKVGQIDCASEYLPPMGCLQYHLESSGTIMTFNFDKIHLPNQDYSVCVRRMAGFCCVEYQTCSDNTDSFRLGSAMTAANGLLATQGSVECNEDFIGIAGGSQDGSIPTQNKFCGSFLSAAVGGGADVPVITCSDYKVRIYTDDVADTNPFVGGGPSEKGACLEYKLLPC